METNRIIIKLLSMLIDAAGVVQTDHASGELRVSKRVLLYNTKKLNDNLESKGFPVVSFSNENLSLDTAKADDMKREFLLCRSIDRSYVLSPEERKILALLIIGLLSSKGSTLEFLADVMCVSKSTTAGCVNQLREELDKNEISLIYKRKPQAGYTLVGDESTIRRCLSDCILQADTAQMNAYIDTLLLGEAFGAAVEEKSRLFGLISDAIENAGKSVNVRYSYNSLLDITYSLLLTSCRGNKSERLVSDAFLESSQEYYMATYKLIDELNKIGLRINRGEEVYIAAILQSGKRSDNIESISKSPDLVESMADELIELFELSTCVVFDERKQLRQKLLIHMRPMYYRLKYKIKSDNRYSNSIREEYPDIFTIIRRCILAISPKYGIDVPDDEIAYLCVYFVSWLSRNRIKQVSHEERILIVCGAGVGTSLFIRHQVTDIIGEGYAIDLRDINSVLEEDLLRYALVISTLQLPYESSKVIIVQPSLTTQDKEWLLSWHFRNKKRMDNSYLEELMSMIAQNTIIINRSQLVKQLREHVAEREGSKRLRLYDVLVRDAVQSYSGHFEAAEALRIASEPLVRHSAADESYYNEILAIINEHGLYAEIRPGVLIAHARPGGSAKKVGVTCTVFTDGVSFGKANSRVQRVIFTLCTPDNKAHYHVMKDLVTIISDDELIAQIESGGFADTDSLYLALINKIKP